MTEYIIYRHGWSAANQRAEDGLPEKMPVLRVEANSPAEACRLAEKQVTLVAGQRLTAEPAGPIDAVENNLDLKPEALFDDEETTP
jgi:hypothetical protein